MVGPCSSTTLYFIGKEESYELSIGLIVVNFAKSTVDLGLMSRRRTTVLQSNKFCILHDLLLNLSYVSTSRDILN